MRAAPVLILLATGLVISGCADTDPADPPLRFAEQAGPVPSVPWEGGPVYTVRVDEAWAERTAERTGIPLTALLAYAGAAGGSANVAADCGLGWNTLAAIGLVESDHGRHDGSSVAADGLVTPPIYGIVLDGGNTANIPDTDGGELDGNSEFDRAIGPMQLIPQTWRSWNIDGSGDNVPDPQNIFDAAFAAANYLCFMGGDLTTQDGWRAAVAAYNSSDEYLAAVASAAQTYLDDAGD
jgi:membrane-bound lytic murein transglycosylase B